MSSGDQSSGQTSSSASTLPSSITDVSTSNSGSDVWGVLYPMENCTQYKVISLDHEGDYIVGRHPNCDYKISKKGFDKSNELKELFLNISKQHFKIYRIKDASTNGYSVRLTDLSLNGTFVNRSNVGRQETITLSNCSIISLAGNKEEHDAFLFVNTKDLSREEQQLPKEFKKKYRLQRWRLGGGAMGSIRRGCLVLNEEEKVAVQIIQRKDTSQFSKELAYESHLMRRLDHPHIINILDIYETTSMLLIIHQYAEGGDLLDHITRNGAIEQTVVKTHFMTLLQALLYLHSELGFHWNLKPNNILLTAKDISKCCMKITDFALTRLLAEAPVMSTVCGTSIYAAPEVFTGKTVGYPAKLDVWSMGCVLFNMLSATMPFPKDNANIFQCGTVQFNSKIWQSIDVQLMNLIRRMLKVNPEERFSVQDAIHALQNDGGGVKHGVKRQLCGGRSQEESSKRLHGN